MAFPFKKRNIGFSEYVRLFFLFYTLLSVAYIVSEQMVGVRLGNNVFPLYQPIFASAFIGNLFAIAEGEQPLWEESW